MKTRHFRHANSPFFPNFLLFDYALKHLIKGFRGKCCVQSDWR